jgi:two-component system KDP operon response regulator KdpE
MGASVARPRTRILAVSDEVQLQRLLRSILEANGREIFAATHSAAEAPTAEPPDVVLLDLDRLDPRVVSQATRAFAGAEVIALCHAYSEPDCVAVLEMGADYLARPFREQELAARVHAAELRRLTAKGYQRAYRHGSFAIDLLDWIVTRDGRRLSLTASEQRVLAVLAREPGRLATFGEILAGLGREDSWRNRQSVHAVVVELRRKIECDPKRPVLLLNVHRIGYRLAPEPGDSAIVAADARPAEGKGGASP